MKLTKQRIDEIANRYHPEGWRVFESRRINSGVAIYAKKTIRIAPICCRGTLHVFLHECAHVHLGHETAGLTLHRQEYEAERWAIEIARQNGIAIWKATLRDARAYVRACIHKDRKKGIPIELHVERWAHQ